MCEFEFAKVIVVPVQQMDVTCKWSLDPPQSAGIGSSLGAKETT